MNDSPSWPYGKVTLLKCRLCCARFGRPASDSDRGIVMDEGRLSTSQPRLLDEVVRYHLEHREQGQA